MKVKHFVQFGIIAIILVAVIIANTIVFEPSMAQNITGFLCVPEVSEDSLAAERAEGQTLANNIMLEGSVLAKNNGVLPLDYETEDSVNVFGYASIDWVYGGSGSGQVLPESPSNPDANVDFLEALDLFNVKYNSALPVMYNSFAAPVGDIGAINTFYDEFYRLCEPDIEDSKYYTPALLSGAKNFSDVAIVVIGRHAGETEDPTRIQYKRNASSATDTTRHYLEISTEEEGLLKYVGQNYDKVIVIVNSTNAMELDFVDTIPGIDACLVVGATGTKGATAIPYLLYGEDPDGNKVSPSGHFVDTYAYDMSSNISYKRTSAAGLGHYTNASELYPTGKKSNAGVTPRTAPVFVDYIENIYVGYKWYETADKEGIWQNYERKIYDENNKEVTVKGYDAVVQYPFGYGLSYTQFAWTVNSLSLSNGSAITDKSKIEIEVVVQNIGDYPGQDVVEVYVTPTYYKGGIEKSHVTLVGFEKTHTIRPGENETIKIELDAYDFASYDAYDKNNNGFKGYELEKGSYEIKLMTDSHTVKKVDFVLGDKDVEGVITYTVDEDIKIQNDPVTGAKVSNLFTGSDSKECVSIDGSDSNQSIGFITRAAFIDPKSVPDQTNRTMTAEVKKYNTYSVSENAEWDNAATDLWGNPVYSGTVTWGASAGTLTDANGTSYADSVGSDGKAKVYMNGQVTSLGLVLGSDYNHPLWDKVLDQLSISEAKSVIYEGSFGNAAINSIGKPKLSDLDGPNQVRSFHAGSNPRGTGFPIETVLGQTWNKKLAYSFGLNYGKEMTALKIDGAYAFGANMHRSAWGGRNYEYFSEDSTLTAEMLTQQVKALNNTGHYCWLKHLVCYECEHERDAMYTWCNEQALREIYLKPFRKVIQEGGASGIMTSYNRIGNVWTGGCETLLTKVIRNEFGFNGAVITDYADSWGLDYMVIEDAIRAGGDVLLGHYDSKYTSSYNSSDSDRFQYRLREICHQVTYMFLSARYANSVYNASDDVETIYTGTVVESWEWWRYAVYDIDVVVGVGCLLWGYAILRSTVLKKFFTEDKDSFVQE